MSNLHKLEPPFDQQMNEGTKFLDNFIIKEKHFIRTWTIRVWGIFIFNTNEIQGKSRKLKVIQYVEIYKTMRMEMLGELSLTSIHKNLLTTKWIAFWINQNVISNTIIENDNKKSNWLNNLSTIFELFEFVTFSMMNITYFLHYNPFSFTKEIQRE